MGAGGRISRGWRLTKVSLSIVRQDAALTGLALLGLVVAVLLAAVPLIGAAFALGDDQNVIGWILLAVTVFAAYFALTFFGVAIVFAANDVVQGKDATVGSACGAAMGRLGPIVGWAIVGTVVNLLLSALRDRGGIAGAILAGLGGAAWSLISFLAVPVIAFEGLGPFATLKRSASLFRGRWGEQVTGTVSIGLVFFLASLPALALAVVGLMVGGVFGVVLAILGVLVAIALGVVSRAASATFGALLYRYATTGESEPFPEAELAGIAR